jgi:hypothetical protein
LDLNSFEGLMRTSFLASKSNRKSRKDFIATMPVDVTLDPPSRAFQAVPSACGSKNELDIKFKELVKLN